MLVESNLSSRPDGYLARLRNVKNAKSIIIFLTPFVNLMSRGHCSSQDRLDSQRNCSLGDLMWRIRVLGR